MDKTTLVVIIAAAVIFVICGGYVLAGQQHPFESSRQPDLALSTPVATPASLQSPIVPGNRSTPAITAEEAASLAREAFPGFDPDHVNITYHAGDRSSQAFIEFDLKKEDTRLVQGGLDPESGNLVWYAIPVARIGRPAGPAVTIETARAASDKEIRNRDGVLSLNLSSQRYDLLGMPDSGVAGVYVFVYDRLTKKDRCDSDGFTIDVDSVSGKVIEYRKTWTQPPGSIC
jgi:hypothetical protein